GPAAPPRGLPSGGHSSGLLGPRARVRRGVGAPRPPPPPRGARRRRHARPTADVAQSRSPLASAGWRHPTVFENRNGFGLFSSTFSPPRPPLATWFPRPRKRPKPAPQSRFRVQASPWRAFEKG